MARLAVYGAISTVLAGGVIAGAFAQRSNFYAACIYLYKSNACMMVTIPSQPQWIGSQASFRGVNILGGELRLKGGSRRM